MQYRLTGLFQPDRVDDLRRQAGTLTIDDGDAPAEVRLVDVNYETAVVTFAYDADSKQFKDQESAASARTYQQSAAQRVTRRLSTFIR